MDSSERDMFGLAKRSEDHLNHHNAGISVDRQFDNPSMGLITTNTSIAISQGNQMGSSPCPSVSVANSFPSLWNCENSLQTTMSTSNIVSAGKPVPLSSRLDMDWSSLESMSKGGMFLQTGPGILPPSLSHFPSDPAFIEPASRLSCFNGGSFSGMVNPFGTSESLSPYSNASKGVVGALMQKSDLTATQAFKGVDRESNGSPMKNQRDKVSLQINDYREPDFNGSDQKESPDSANGSGNSSFKGLDSKKKRSHQDMELEQVQRGPQLTAENTNAKQKLEQNNNSTLATVKPNGKQSKDNSDAAKEDYIHMRARRGQATNSHSLAERVRREKISERMKYLQELVPGCTKVTGKAVMLDEIINYVQSLQRQVEFLSMKLATVNPRLDFNIEGLLSNDLQSRGGTSMIGFSPDMMHTQLHPSQQGLIQAGISGFVNHSDALRKGVLSQLTAMNVYKEPTPQTHDAWDNQLHSFVQMTFGANPHINTQESNDKPRDGFPL